MVAPGLRFGNMTVMRPAPGPKSLWECICRCGKTELRPEDNIRQAVRLNRGSACAKCRDGARASRRIYTGRVVGKLTVIGKVGAGSWRCRCECGEEVVRLSRVLQASMKARSIASCGECRRHAAKRRAKGSSPLVCSQCKHERTSEQMIPRSDVCLVCRPKHMRMCPVCLNLGERRSKTTPCCGCGRLYQQDKIEP